MTQFPNPLATLLAAGALAVAVIAAGVLVLSRAQAATAAPVPPATKAVKDEQS